MKALLLAKDIRSRGWLLLWWCIVIVVSVSQLQRSDASVTSAIDNDATQMTESEDSAQQWRQLHSSPASMRHPVRLVDILNRRVRRNRRRSNRRSGNSKESVSTSDETNDVQELYFTQFLDHFRMTDEDAISYTYTASDQRHSQTRHQTISATPETFQQRYFVSTRYVRTPKTKSPTLIPQELIFVCVGGEGPALDTSVLIDSVHCTGDMLSTARQLFDRIPNVSITLAALEHRYYGKSYPVFTMTNATTTTTTTISPVTNENLRYLSSKQATADLAHFIHTLFQVNEQTTNVDANSPLVAPRVVLFGGSYPGVLAAFARLKYPHMVHAAVSNSAPVQAILDFAAYQTHVGQVLTETDPHCHDIVATGHLILGQMVQTTQTLNQTDDNDTVFKALAQQFHLCNSTSLHSLRNQQMWLGDGVFYVGTQENDPSCDHSLGRNGSGGDDYCNIPAKCRALTNQFSHEMENENATIQTAAVAALAWLATTLQSTSNDATDEDSCLELDWDATVEYIADPVRGQDEGLRSWLWQTCTEFGFYQTCETNGCPFTVGYHPLSIDMEICAKAFGLDALSVAKAVQATNEYTGGWHMEATRIVSVTGSVDPWTEMSVQTTRPNSTATVDSPVVYQVPGASHHFWTHPILPTDDSAVIAAREFIFNTVHGWLFPNTEVNSQVDKMLRGGTSDATYHQMQSVVTL